ncbi:hypothetical protein [uncultured Flavonifractor sp.]|uniref:hypothetical protein n=1 Tax=uncultured Flavonifractor sp. TaxID=1193534 RepID=UPI002619B105|nr:hypothetical protein [uncultured Flavonifractor sp.]
MASVELSYYYGYEAEQFSFYRIPKLLFTDNRFAGISTDAKLLYCARTVGLESLPVIVREYTDDEADILVVDYNITREDLLPSEKARAYSLKLEAMKRQAGRPSKNSLQVGENFRGKFSVQILSEQVGENVTNIQRYIRLTKLIPPLLEQVDNGVLKVTPAADYISHLSEKEQTALLVIMERDEVSPSLGQAKRLKELSEAGKLDATSSPRFRPRTATFWTPPLTRSICGPVKPPRSPLRTKRNRA